MTLHVVFLGNCQIAQIGNVLRRFIGPYEGITTEYIHAYNNITDASYAALHQARVVVTQCTINPPPLDHSHIPPGAIRHSVPLVSGGFLWPNQGTPHPLRPVARYGNPPYTPEYSDRFLARLVVEKTPPEAALAQYKSLDLAGTSGAQRLYELTMETQRRLDDECGYNCAGIIEDHLQHERLFQSAFHFGGRIGRHIAATLADRMGFSAKYGVRIRAHLRDMPFVPRFVPVHPSIARAFGMTWVQDNTQYPFLCEGGYSFDEYVLRFMEGKWSAALQEGIIDAVRGTPGAREKLEQGVIEAPRSAEGHHELSRIHEGLGDDETAFALQQRAVELGPSVGLLLRLATLLERQHQPERAAEILQRATVADPVSVVAWTRLRDSLGSLERHEQAVHAAERVVDLATNPAPAQRVLARMQADMHRAGATQ